MKVTINEFEETLETTNKIIYAAAYVITERINGEAKNYMRKRNYRQLRWKSKIKQEIKFYKEQYLHFYRQSSIFKIDKKSFCRELRKERLNFEKP